VISKLHQTFRAARRAGTPIIAIRTLDPEATIQGLQAKVINRPDSKVQTPIIQWDRIRGFIHRNEEGLKAITQCIAGSNNPINPVDMTIEAEKMPFDPQTRMATNPIIFVLNAHTFFETSCPDRDAFIQGLWNLRIPYRDSLRSIVLLGPDFHFPPEISHDILLLNEPLPSDDEIRGIIKETITAYGKNIPSDDQLNEGVSALRGLVAWEAERATAMSLTKEGLQTSELWLKKKEMISAHPALSVWIGGQKFDDLGGLEAAKKRFRRIIKSKQPIRVIIWIDEIEKAMAGVGQESSGTSSDQLAVILSEMQDKLYTGALFLGIPGAAKSALAKAIANEAGCITIKLDLGASKGEGLVGQAENQIREAFKIIEAVGGIGGAFFVATSNDIRVVRPELKRRFKKGIWFFDLPTEQERDSIWDIYFNKYPEVNRKQKAKVDDRLWTGHEIETCVMTAWEEDVTLQEAAESIIPVAVSAKENIEMLRAEAAGRYNSVSYPGVYQLPTQGLQTSTPKNRRIARGELE
jgi:hypothetical protein